MSDFLRCAEQDEGRRARAWLVKAGAVAAVSCAALWPVVGWAAPVVVLAVTALVPSTGGARG